MSDAKLDALLRALIQGGFSLPHYVSPNDYEDVSDVLEANDKAWEENRNELRRALEEAEVI